MEGIEVIPCGFNYTLQAGASNAPTCRYNIPRVQCYLVKMAEGCCAVADSKPVEAVSNLKLSHLELS